MVYPYFRVLGAKVIMPDDGVQVFDYRINKTDKGPYESTYLRKRFLNRLQRDGRVRGFEASWKRYDGSIIFIREKMRGQSVLPMEQSSSMKGPWKTLVKGRKNRSGKTGQ